MAFAQALPRSLSPSRLQDFQACPRRYQYGAVERRERPASYAATKGRFVHAVFEKLLDAEAEQRSADLAYSLIPDAGRRVLDDKVRAELALDADAEARLNSEVRAIVDTYLVMEDPRLVTHEGVELRLNATIEQTPLFGILDRLDRDANGDLVIVDYKTGSLPRRDYESSSFANTELYAALCEEKLGERPRRIRLMYVAQGESLERSVTEVVTRARVGAAAGAWRKIRGYFDAGQFPARPSPSGCRFCDFSNICPDAAVTVSAH